jgi:vacuolar-type H+-ATPase subunit E/Vma4
VSIDALRAALEAEAQVRAGDVLRRAFEEAWRIRHEAEAEAARRLAWTLAPHEAKLRRAARHSIGAARHRAQERVLRERQALLDRVFDEAASEWGAIIASDTYQRSLAEQVKHALGYLCGPAVIECPPSLAPMLRSAIRARDDVEVAVDPGVPPGFRVRAQDGSVQVDATLEARLERERPRLAIELLRRLEGES